MDIEEVAEKTPTPFLPEENKPCNRLIGLFQARKIAFKLRVVGRLFRK